STTQPHDRGTIEAVAIDGRGDYRALVIGRRRCVSWIDRHVERTVGDGALGRRDRAGLRLQLGAECPDYPTVAHRRDRDRAGIAVEWCRPRLAPLAEQQYATRVGADVDSQRIGARRRDSRQGEG